MQTANSRPPINEQLNHFLLEYQINSFNKVWFLLFLWQRNDHSVNRSFARIATFCDDPTLDEVIGELESAGLLVVEDDMCNLRREAEIERGLAAMLSTYEDPIARQSLLSRLYRQTATYHN